MIGELYFGANNSRRVAANTARIDDFLSKALLVVCDAQTARNYGQVKKALLMKGRPIPENDMWIAAAAVQHGLALLTRDKHFEYVEGLKVETW